MSWDGLLNRTECVASTGAEMPPLGVLGFTTPRLSHPSHRGLVHLGHLPARGDLPATEEASRELERGCGKGPGVTGQERMYSHCQRAGLDGILERNAYL